MKIWINSNLNPTGLVFKFQHMVYEKTRTKNIHYLNKKRKYVRNLILWNIKLFMQHVLKMQ